MSNFKKISEVEIKTVIQLHSKADSLDYESLIKILTFEPITKEIAIIVLKKILMNATVLTKQAIQTLQLLISLGASFDLLEDGDGCTALMNACLKGSHELACFIIQENPEQLFKTSKQGRNCLFYSISSNFAKLNIDLVHTLLNAGVNPNHRENLQGDSCLSLAVKNGYSQISSLLLQYGADPNIILETKKQTMLHVVCNNLNLELLKILLLKGANPNIKNAKGEFPIDILKSKLNDITSSTEDFTVIKTMTDLVSMFMIPDHSLITEVANNSQSQQTKVITDPVSNRMINSPAQITSTNDQTNLPRNVKIDIKSIRKELIINKNNPEIEEFLTGGLVSDQTKDVKKEIAAKQEGNIDIQISPSSNLAEKFENSKGRDIISVPITVDFSTTEVGKTLII